VCVCVKVVASYSEADNDIVISSQQNHWSYSYDMIEMLQRLICLTIDSQC